MIERSPLIKRTKLEVGLLGGESSELENNILPEFNPITTSSKNSNHFSPKALDFEGHLLSSGRSSEIYTPSFVHKNEEFEKESPLSFINQESHRKRKNKFRQRNEEVPFIGHLMINNEGQQILQPMYPAQHRELSLPQPIQFG